MSEVLNMEQLALLSNLMYSVEFTQQTSGTDYRGESIGDILDRLGAEIINNPGSMQNQEDWAVLINAVKDDPALSSLTLQNMNTDPAAGAPMAYFTSADNTPYLVFCGTADHEWGYDFEGAFTSDTAVKRATLKWVDSLNLDPNNPAIVTGHSDGGNDAMYITVLRGDLVKLCVPFNAQQFSQEFKLKYKVLISIASEKIIAINSSNDFVSAVSLENIAHMTIYI